MGGGREVVMGGDQTKGGSAPCLSQATTLVVERRGGGKLGTEREMSALPSASLSTNEG